MKATTPLSIAVITKNRTADVIACIRSIMVQTGSGDEIIVIDGSDNGRTQAALRKLAHESVVRIRYTRDLKPGLARARNRAIRLSGNDWLAFIDDDCVLDPQWVTSMKRAIARHKGIRAFTGRSETFFPRNTFSLSERFHELQWKLPALHGPEIIDLEILDTKNIVFNRRWIIAQGLLFDETLSKYPHSTNDDIDFGMQIWRAGGEAMHIETSVIYHKDATTLSKFIKKAWTDTISYMLYRRKWLRERSVIDQTLNRVDRGDIWSRISRSYHPDWFLLMRISVILFLSGWITRSARIYARIKYRI